METIPEHAPLILFGGSFNPPHLAHFRIAHAALTAFTTQLSPAPEMLIIPSGQPWQKPNVAPAKDRLAMLQLAVADDQRRYQNLTHSHQYPIHIDTLEIERNTPSYTIDTLRILRKRWPSTLLIWLMGSDQLLNFHTWRDWPEILQYTHIAVANRAGYEFNATQLTDNSLRDYYQTHHCPIQTDLWQSHPHGWFIHFPAPSIAVSSTQLREQIRQHQPTPELADDVKAYIQQHHLYQ